MLISNVSAQVSGFDPSEISPSDSFSSDYLLSKDLINEAKQIIENVNSFDDSSILEDLNLINPNFDWENLIAPKSQNYEEVSKEWESIAKDYEEIVLQGGSPDSIKDKLFDIFQKVSENTDIEKVLFFGNPQIDGLIMDEVFRITDMTVEETAIFPDGTEDLTKLLIRGMGPPDSTIFLFIYSTPIIVDTRTNSEGEWFYLLNQEIEDGSHEVYVALADETGKVIAKSSPVPFVKEAAAIQVDLVYPMEGEFSALSFFDGKFFSVLAVIFLFLTIITIIIAGISIGKEKKI